MLTGFTADSKPVQHILLVTPQLTMLALLPQHWLCGVPAQPQQPLPLEPASPGPLAAGTY